MNVHIFTRHPLFCMIHLSLVVSVFKISHEISPTSRSSQPTSSRYFTCAYQATTTWKWDRSTRHCHQKSGLVFEHIGAWRNDQDSRLWEHVPTNRDRRQSTGETTIDFAVPILVTTSTAAVIIGVPLLPTVRERNWVVVDISCDNLDCVGKFAFNLDWGSRSPLGFFNTPEFLTVRTLDDERKSIRVSRRVWFLILDNVETTLTVRSYWVTWSGQTLVMGPNQFICQHQPGRTQQECAHQMKVPPKQWLLAKSSFFFHVSSWSKVIRSFPWRFHEYPVWLEMKFTYQIEPVRLTRRIQCDWFTLQKFLYSGKPSRVSNRNRFNHRGSYSNWDKIPLSSVHFPFVPPPRMAHPYPLHEGFTSSKDLPYQAYNTLSER